MPRAARAAKTAAVALHQLWRRIALTTAGTPAFDTPKNCSVGTSGIRSVAEMSQAMAAGKAQPAER
jgi:hypothetical protein